MTLGLSMFLLGEKYLYLIGEELAHLGPGDFFFRFLLNDSDQDDQTQVVRREEVQVVFVRAHQRMISIQMKLNRLNINK